MKKVITLLLIAAVIFIGITMYQSINEIDFTEFQNDSIYTDKEDIKRIKLDTYTFKNIGYYKGKDNTRCLTYNIKTQEIIDKNNIPLDLINEATKHGLNESNTEGKLTVVFYYALPNSAPQITNLHHSEAMDVAHNHKPIIAVWQFGNGKHKVIFNPE